MRKEKGKGTPIFPFIKSYKEKWVSPNREPLLAINEFEEAAGAILDLTKDRTIIMLQEASQKAGELIQKTKEASAVLEKEYLEKTEAEIKLEKERLSLEVKEKLKLIEALPKDKIRQAVDYVLERLLP